MSLSSTLLLTLLLAQTESFTPARLDSGGVGQVPVTTRAAGLVLTELTVDERGRVAGVDALQRAEPFSELIREAVASWSFTAARGQGGRLESQVLVAGLFRPAMLQFPAPEVMKAPDREPECVPFPTEVAVPPYPPNLVGDATVLVEVEVDAKGAVQDARVRGEESGFDDAASSTARDWAFRPARRGDRDVPAIVYLVFGFRQPVQ